MDLDNDGGVCNAILYDRVTKVFILNPGCKKISNRGIRILQTKMCEIIQHSCALCPCNDWIIMYLSKSFGYRQICTMGEGRLVSPPSVDTGLRVAWARSGILSKGMKFPGGNLGQFRLLESFLCCTSLTLILTWSKLYYSVLSGCLIVLGLRWTGILNTKRYMTRSTGDLIVLIWSMYH